MEDFLTLQLSLTEAKFLSEVAAGTAALAVDTESIKIVHATGEAEKLFHCRIKNGLRGMLFENLIPQKYRHAHRHHFAEYLKDPQPRAMGDAKGRLQAQTVTGETFGVAITLNPIKENERLFVILTIMPLAKEKDDLQ